MPTRTAHLRAESHSTLGAVVLRDAGVIVDRWAKRAKDEQPSAKRVHHDVLLDHMPTLLWELGRALADAGGKDSGRHRRPAAVHGDQRWEAGWSLEEVVRDYQLLRVVLVEHLDETLRRPLSTRESMALGVFIDDAIAASVSAFHACQSQATPEPPPAGLRGDQHLDELLSIMGVLGHEIRNPLAPIRNATQVIKLAGDDPARRERARLLIERQLDVMTRLVEDLLDVPRLVRGKMHVKPERTDLARLVRDAAEDRRTAFEENGITLSLALPKTPLWTVGDATRLAQVVGNLLGNAAKFTDRGGEVVVRLGGDFERHLAVLSVRDSGTGIDPSLLPKLFGAFVQADRTVERSRGGLGLGLALVKGIVELHGGTVRAESDGLGKGSEFTVELPLVDLPKAARSRPKLASEVVSRRVLVVEDNVDSAESLKMYLELLGHEVTVAHSGPDGIERARESAPEVVVCDIGLPGMSGHAACAEMRKEVALRDTLFVALSGHAPTELAEKNGHGVFDLHLLKPVDPARLAEVVSAHKTPD